MKLLSDFIRETTVIPALKCAAKKHYDGYQKAVGRLSCGRALAENVSSEVLEHKIKFNEIMDRLSEIDPKCPEFRL